MAAELVLEKPCWAAEGDPFAPSRPGASEIFMFEDEDEEEFEDEDFLEDDELGDEDEFEDEDEDFLEDEDVEEIEGDEDSDEDDEDL